MFMVLLMAEIQLTSRGLVVYPIILQGFSTIPGGFLAGFYTSINNSRCFPQAPRDLSWERNEPSPKKTEAKEARRAEMQSCWTQGQLLQATGWWVGLHLGGVGGIHPPWKNTPFTVPETNSSPLENPRHFDGYLQERWGFSWANS